MNLVILHETEAELLGAVACYEETKPCLGIRLREEARKTLHWIQDHPKLPHLGPKGYRRVNLKVFR